ncbi:glycosyltransferase family 2 protein [Salinisphaera sp.]|uniref:glycosyltransferase family 2 protein n=1 Tax=Salinisphaera sp. TaxID=1914330 RepID=UPI000C53E23E|nr:glycosyltransferase family 2 protein [Salinisphaera sp.]MBS63827.1 family 2 glycosyl transferase [Salinisphaera sp.]
MQSHSASLAARRPRVTVFIPAFNVERYVAAAVNSVLAQTFTDFELLVIDDASTDRTVDIVKRFASDQRLRLVEQPRNLGRARTRNHGLDLAYGDYIAFLDADDCCAPDRLARQVDYLDRNPDIGGVGSWMAWIEADGQPLAEKVLKLSLNADTIAWQMLRECAVAQGSLMLRRTAIANYRYDTSFEFAEDYELWSRMIKTTRFANLPAPLTLYRRHPEQSLSVHRREQNNVQQIIQSSQLGRLGVRHDQADLIRHERLLKFSSRESVLDQTGAPMDIHYLRWAHRWLEALHRGNASAQLYPEPAFSYMLSACWVFTARKSIRLAGLPAVLKELAISRLTRIAIAHPVRIRDTQRAARGRGARY